MSQDLPGEGEGYRWGIKKMVTRDKGEVRTAGEVEWEMNWQCDGKSQHGDLPFSLPPPLQAPPWNEGLSQAALVEGEEERNPKL